MRRTGKVYEEKFTVAQGNGLLQQETRGQSKKNAEHQNQHEKQWKSQIEYFEKGKRVVAERRNVLDQMKNVVLRQQHTKVRADDDRADELG